MLGKVQGSRTGQVKVEPKWPIDEDLYWVEVRQCLMINVIILGSEEDCKANHDKTLCLSVRPRAAYTS